MFYLNIKIIYIFIIIIILSLLNSLPNNYSIEKEIKKTSLKENEKIHKINNIYFKIIKENNDINNQKKTMMSNIINNIYNLKDYLYKNIDKYPKYRKYIINLQKNLNNNTIIKETFDDTKTSYSLNKGEVLSFCLKSKNTKKIHDINTLMYVAIHEIAHIASPEFGHDELFNKIFRFFIVESINIGIYKYVNYNLYPIEYCGMQINSNIL